MRRGTTIASQLFNAREPMTLFELQAWLETRDGLLKMLQEVPLSDEERAAVDGDVEALNRLLERLKEVPPPSKTQQNTSRQFVIAVEHVRRFQDRRGEKESVR